MAHVLTLGSRVLAGLLLPATLVWAQPTSRGEAGPRPVAAGQDASRGEMRSERELQAEITARPTSTRAYFELVQLYRRSKRIEEADALLRSGIAKGADANALYELLAGLYSPTYQPEKVLSIAEDWRRAAPGVRPLTTIVNAHLELAKRLGATSRSEALAHVNDARRAAEDARLLDAENVFVLLALASVARTRAAFETDPAVRAQLLGDAEKLTAQAHARSTRSATTGASTSPPAPSGVSVRPMAPAAPLRVGGNVRPPVKIKDAQPVYPPKAREARLQGVVVAEISINEDGKVTDARVVRSVAGLDQAAIDAVRQWEFEPTLVNGRPVPVVLTVTVQFSLDDRDAIRQQAATLTAQNGCYAIGFAAAAIDE